MKHHQGGFGVVGILGVILVVLGVGAAVWRVQDTTKTNTSARINVSNTDVQPTTIKGVRVHTDKYYAVAVQGPTGNYYGKVQPINSQYFRLSPVYYLNASGTLVMQGQELHAPEGAMYVNVKNVRSFSELKSSDSALSAIQTINKAASAQVVHDAYPSGLIDNYIKPSQLQAVFFSDGTVYFAKLQFASKNPVFADPSQVFELSGNSAQLSLAKVPATHTALYSSGQINFWENLQAEGQVSKAITTYQRQNP